MKTLFISLVVLLFAFFLGCQNSITDPEVLESRNFVDDAQEESVAFKDVFHFTYPNVIRLSETLIDPSQSLYNEVQIEGVVRYGFKKINTTTGGQIPIDFYKTSPSGTPDAKYKVELYVDAVFKSNDPQCNRLWSVKNAAEQTVVISPMNSSVVYIEKLFRLKNTCYAPLDLALKFEVREKELKLVSMKLKLVPDQLPTVVHQ